MHFLTDTRVLFARQLRATTRMPAFVVMSLLQPILWLFLFGQLFGSVIQLEGFDNASYAQFLAPGLAIMTTLFGAAFAGLGLIVDLDQGVLDRFLSTTVSRAAIILGRLGDVVMSAMIQAGILLAAALLLGARPSGGLAGAGVVLLAAALFGIAFGSLSKALALVTKKQEALMGLMNFLVLPMVFTSSMMIDPSLMPGWIQTVAKLNPLDWAVLVARGGFEGRPVAEFATPLMLLSGFAVVAVVLAVLALRGYESSR